MSDTFTARTDPRDDARDVIADALRIEGETGRRRLVVDCLVGDIDTLVARWWSRGYPTVSGIDVAVVPRKVVAAVDVLGGNVLGLEVRLLVPPNPAAVSRPQSHPDDVDFDPKWRILVGGPGIGNGPRAGRHVQIYADDKPVRRVRDIELIAHLHDVVELRISLLPAHVEVVGDANLVALWRCDEHGETFSASKPCPGCCPPDKFMVVRGEWGGDLDYLVAVDVETYSTSWSSSEAEALRLIDLDIALETARNVDGRVERAPNAVAVAAHAAFDDEGATETKPEGEG